MMQQPPSGRVGTMADEAWEHPPVSPPVASQEVELEMQKTEEQPRQEVTFADSTFDSPLSEACQDTPTNTEESASVPLLTSQKSRRQEKVRWTMCDQISNQANYLLARCWFNQTRNSS